MNDYVTKKDLDDSLGKFKAEIKEEFRRHTGLILEEFDKRINFVIEGQEVLTQRVDKIDSRLSNLETKVDKIDSRLSNLETKVDNIHEELISHRDNTELHVQVVKQRGKKRA